MTDWPDIFEGAEPAPPKRSTVGEIKARTQRNEVMVNKLYDQVERGCIDNDWVEEFVVQMKARIGAGLSLSQKQEAKLEEIFERY